MAFNIFMKSFNRLLYIETSKHPIFYLTKTSMQRLEILIWLGFSKRMDPVLHYTLLGQCKFLYVPILFEIVTCYMKLYYLCGQYMFENQHNKLLLKLWPCAIVKKIDNLNLSSTCATFS